MRSLDLLRMAVGNLIRRAARTFLTILGVVIGTASIVTMLSLGIAMDEGFKEQLSYMGDLTIIEIYDSGMYGGPSQGGGNKAPKLNEDAVATFKKIPHVKGVMPIKSVHMKMGAGKFVAYSSIIGVDPAIMDAFDFKIAEGRLLTATDKNMVVVGKYIPYNFYNPKQRGGNNWGYWGMDGGDPPVDLLTSKMVMTSDYNYGEPPMPGGQEPVGNPPKIYDIKAVGILEESNSEKDYNVYMNIEALDKIIEEERRNQRGDGMGRPSQQNESKYERINVKVDDFTNVEAVNEQIKSFGFQTYSLTDILKSMKEQSKMIQAILGGIGGVSLFVAAIGITNTMVMSIYERTREIGVMKVIGADLDDIKRLFLIEAGMLGLFGGLLGVGLSYGVSAILNQVGGSGLLGYGGGSSISIIPTELSLAAIVFATFIGLLSGYSPARRAMNISALDAIRTDK